MKSLEYESGMDSEKKVMVSIFWTNRKAARTEGCATFNIEKIKTANNTYLHVGHELLKINDEIMADMVKTLDAGHPIHMEFNIGDENIKASLTSDSFTVSVEKSPEIEEEIIEKLKGELVKKYPSYCDSFAPRVTTSS